VLLIVNSCNFHVLYKTIFGNKFDLFWTRTLFYTSAQQTSRMMLPTLVLRRNDLATYKFKTAIQLRDKNYNCFILANNTKDDIQIEQQQQHEEAGATVAAISASAVKEKAAQSFCLWQ